MASENTSGPKLGASALSGYWRQGLAELRAASPLGDSNIAQPTDHAMPGMKTQGEIAATRREGSLDLDDKSGFGSRTNQIGPPRDEPGRDDPNNGLDP
jgi:hypothetical protein